MRAFLLLLVLASCDRIVTTAPTYRPGDLVELRTGETVIVVEARAHQHAPDEPANPFYVVRFHFGTKVSFRDRTALLLRGRQSVREADIARRRA